MEAILLLSFSRCTLSVLYSECCRFCRQRSEDEARDTFKMLKSQLIGDSFAYLYSEWALLEDAAGEQHVPRCHAACGVSNCMKCISLCTWITCR